MLPFGEFMKFFKLLKKLFILIIILCFENNEDKIKIFIFDQDGTNRYSMGIIEGQQKKIVSYFPEVIKMFYKIFIYIYNLYP